MGLPSAGVDLGIGGRTAAVAAASRGLGFAAAQALANEGVRVAICGRDRGRVEDAAARIGPRAVALVHDVSTADGASRFVEEAAAELGAVDILVANAGGPPAARFEELDLGRYRAAIEENLLSIVAMCVAAVPAMRERRWGRIVAITSYVVSHPRPTMTLSVTARSGATAFLQTLAQDVARDGITVNTVEPGLHATARLEELYGGDLTRVADGVPAGVVGDPADLGTVIAFLCSEHARYVTGNSIVVAGGAT